MPEITMESILSELNKPLDTPYGALSAEQLGMRLEVPREHTKPEWLVFYKELNYCIEGGLVKFYWKHEYEEYQANFQADIDISFYMNHLQKKLIGITPEGKLWLNQQNMTKNIQDVKSSVYILLL